MSDEVVVRRATVSDLDGILELLNKLAEYEHASEPFAPDRETFAGALFGPQPQAQVFLAETPPAEAVGLALFFDKFNVWTGSPGVWLAELFVRPESRGTVTAVPSFRQSRQLQWAGAAAASNGPSSIGTRPLPGSTHGWVRRGWTTAPRSASAVTHSRGSPGHRSGRDRRVTVARVMSNEAMGS